MCASWKQQLGKVQVSDSNLHHRCSIAGQTHEEGTKLHFLFSDSLIWFHFNHKMSRFCCIFSQFVEARHDNKLRAVGAVVPAGEVNLNSAHEKCRWIHPPPLSFGTSLENVSRFQSPGVLHELLRDLSGLHPPSRGGWRKEKKREARLLLPEHQRRLSSSVWPSKASVMFDPSLHFSAAPSPLAYRCRVLMNIADPRAPLLKPHQNYWEPEPKMKI